MQWSSVFLGRQLHSPAKGRGPVVPHKFWDLLHARMRAHSMRDTVSKLHVRKILRGRPRMLTRDLFAVTNILV